MTSRSGGLEVSRVLLPGHCNLNNTLVNGSDIGYAITVADNGDIIIGGLTQNQFSAGDASVFRFTATGSFVWQQIIDKGFSDAIRAVTIRAGIVVVAGRLSESNASDFFVAGLDANDGHKLWDYLSPGIENGFLTALALAFAPDGVVVTGVSEEADALSTFQVIKVDPATGRYCGLCPSPALLRCITKGMRRW